MPENAPAVVKPPVSSKIQAMLDIERQWDSLRYADQRNRRREYRNWRCYFGVDGGQYTAEQVAKFLNEGRYPDQFNVVARKVDIALGNEMSQIWDFDWVPIEGERTSGTESVKETYYADKEQLNYDATFRNVIRDGLVYRGIAEMGITKKISPIGNIFFERVSPTYGFFDPYWITDDDNDCELFFKVGYFRAKAVKEIWGVESAKIDSAIATEDAAGIYYDQKTFDEYEDVRADRKSGAYRVIEKNWLVREKSKRLYGYTFTPTGSQVVIPFPETEDKATLQQFAMNNQIDWGSTFIAPHEKRVLYKAAICPQLIEDGPLFEGKDDIQIGRLKQFHFSYNRALGIDKGMVDDLYDLQQNLNRREAKETDIIETSTGGGKLLNSNIFKTADQRERYLKNGNDPSYREFIDGDELEKGVPPVIDLHSMQFPGQVLDIPRLYDLADRLSPVTAAQSAMSESASESGVLFERKLAVSRIGQLPLDERIRKLMHDMGEGYFYQWQQTYDGPPRQFSTRDGQHSVVLNEIVYGQNGSMGWLNRPKFTPRCRVVVTESPRSESWQMRKRSYYADILKAIPQTPEYRNHIQFFINEIVKTLDISDQQKARLEALEKMNQFKSMLADATEVANMMASKNQATLVAVQAQQALQSMMAQVMGPAPGGAPQGPPVQQQITMSDQESVAVEPEALGGIGNQRTLSLPGE